MSKAPLNISRVFAGQAVGPKNALVYYGKTFSYEELGSFARLFAQIFIRLGVKKGDRVALMMSNAPQFVFSYYGALLAGAIVTPINLLSIPSSYSAKNDTVAVPDEIRAQLIDAEPSLIVAFDFYFPLIMRLRRDLKWLRATKIVLTSPADSVPFWMRPLAALKLRFSGRKPRIQKRQDPAWMPTWLYYLHKELSRDNRPLPFDVFPGMEARMNDVAQLQYTGGTTGIPKGAILTHNNLLVNMNQVREHIGEFLEQEKEVVLGILPFFHIYGLTAIMQMALLGHRGTIVLVPDPQDINQWVKWIKQHKVTILPGVPRLYERLASHYSRNRLAQKFSSIKFFLNGAGALAPSVRQVFKETFPAAPILDGYGLTEASPVVSASLPSSIKEGSVGKPLPQTQVKIADLISRAFLPALQEGEIMVNGPQVMRGYWQKHEETAQVISRSWLLTGDIGYLDEEGFLHITDRLKDMVKIKGENVFPSKIEKLLALHSAVKEVSVVGFADAEGRESLAAYLVLNDAFGPQDDALKEDLKRWMRGRLAEFEVPQHIRFMDNLDAYKDPLGKVVKRKIREEIQKGQH